MANGVGHVDRNNGIAVQRDHHAEAAGGDQVDGGHAEACRQNAVEGRRRTSALNVPEHADSNIISRNAGDAVEDQVAEVAGAAILFELLWQLLRLRPLQRW